MNQSRVALEAYRLGRTHAEYAQYGLKPHFLGEWNRRLAQMRQFQVQAYPSPDIYQQQFTGILNKLEIPDSTAEEKLDMLKGFTLLTSFIIDIMNYAYGQRIMELRQSEKRAIKNDG